MVEHTKLPWRVEGGTDLIWGACSEDDESTYGMGYSIAQGVNASYHAKKPDMNEREANAAFIVRAVNNHEAMVRALEFYADQRRYDGPNQRPIDGDPHADDGAVYIKDVTRDHGAIAIAALKGAKP